MTVSTAAKQAIFAQQVDKAFLMLLTITHDDIPGPLRFVNNPVAITSRGNEYIPWPFQLDLPPQEPQQPPQARIVIDNVSPEVIDAIRSLSDSPVVTIEIVLSDTPDTVEVGPFDLNLTRVDYDSMTIEGSLAYEDVLNEPFPARTFNPAEWPGLFR